jgi:mRNA interferase RelE/StbE
VLSDKYLIAETKKFQKTISQINLRSYYPKIKDTVYPILRLNPHYGPHIKRLKGDMSMMCRYRIGDFRLFYYIDEKEKTVFVLDFENRKDAYD